MSLLFIITALGSAKLSIERLIESHIPLETNHLDQLDNGISRIGRLQDEGLVIFYIQKGEIQYYNFADASMSTLSTRGQGPDQLDGGFISGTVLNRDILVTELNSSDIKVRRLNESQFRLASPGRDWFTKSHIQVNQELVYAVVHAVGNDDNPLDRTPTDCLAVFHKKDDRLELQGTFFDRDLMDDWKANRFYSQKTELLKASTPGHFYRIPMWGSPVMQVFNEHGNLVREFAIPHPKAHRLPKDPAIRLAKYKDRRKMRLVMNADSDKNGNAHLLLSTLFDGEGKNLSSRFIVKMNEFGEILSIFKSEHQLYYFAVSEDGDRYYGVDFDYNLVRLTHP